MGQSLSQFEVIDYAENRQFSKKQNIKEWQILRWHTILTPPKNSKYYDGTRFFKVPRHMYPQYTKGYIYGYYESVEYYKNYITQYDKHD